MLVASVTEWTGRHSAQIHSLTLVVTQVLFPRRIALA
jgi:hypothetical protein